MRLVTAGVNGDGRSCVLRIEKKGKGDVAWSTSVFPPELDYIRPKTVAVETRTPKESAVAVFQFHTFSANGEFKQHRMNCFSLVTITEGMIALTLEDGEIDLAVGDVLIMPGVVHGWRTGASICHCTIMRFNLGPP